GGRRARADLPAGDQASRLRHAVLDGVDGRAIRQRERQLDLHPGTARLEQLLHRLRYVDAHGKLRRTKTEESCPTPRGASFTTPTRTSWRCRASSPSISRRSIARG